MTTDQVKSLLLAWPRRVKFYRDETIIECTACRAYFTNGKAWKAHRRTGTCDTTRLVSNALGIWQKPVRKRVQS